MVYSTEVLIINSRLTHEHTHTQNRRSHGAEEAAWTAVRTVPFASNSRQTSLHVHLFVSLRSCGRRLAVFGHVASVCSLLLVRGTSFFFFSLTDHTHTLPVLVKVGHSSPQDGFLKGQTLQSG